MTNEEIKKMEYYNENFIGMPAGRGKIIKRFYSVEIKNGYDVIGCEIENI